MIDLENKKSQCSEHRNHYINSLELNEVWIFLTSKRKWLPSAPLAGLGGLEGENQNFAPATGEGGVGSWNLLCEHLENIYKMKKYN